MTKAPTCGGRPVPPDHTYGMWCSGAKLWVRTFRTRVGAEHSKRIGVWGICDVVRKIRH